jgi:hypothetical protein
MGAVDHSIAVLLRARQKSKIALRSLQTVPEGQSLSDNIANHSLDLGIWRGFEGDQDGVSDKISSHIVELGK